MTFLVKSALTSEQRLPQLLDKTISRAVRGESHTGHDIARLEFTDGSWAEFEINGYDAVLDYAYTDGP